MYEQGTRTAIESAHDEQKYFAQARVLRVSETYDHTISLRCAACNADDASTTARKATPARRERPNELHSLPRTTMQQLPQQTLHRTHHTSLTLRDRHRTTRGRAHNTQLLRGSTAYRSSVRSRAMLSARPGPVFIVLGVGSLFALVDIAQPFETIIRGAEDFDGLRDEMVSGDITVDAQPDLLKTRVGHSRSSDAPQTIRRLTVQRMATTSGFRSRPATSLRMEATR
jgi:hypothetical protein